MKYFFNETDKHGNPIDKTEISRFMASNLLGANQVSLSTLEHQARTQDSSEHLLNDTTSLTIKL